MAKNEMNRLSICQALLCLLLVQTMAQQPPFLRSNRMAFPVPLSCTASCKELSDLKDTPDVVCSCSSSCLIYGDCCHDAPYKNNDGEKKNLGCLKLSGLGPVAVVKSCPTSSGILSEACRTGLGVTDPVTSKETGITYSNYYCAVCNGDSFNLVDWPVEFRCCKQNRKILNMIVKEHMEYDSEKDILWSVSQLDNGSKVFCECTFYARNDDISFAKSLELRDCKQHGISSCAATWDTESTRKLCSAYLDPIYSDDKVYRNRHCATCNFESGRNLKCSAETFNPLLASRDRLLAFCKARNITDCLSYLRAKGHTISFHELFTIKEVQCMPPEGRLCCAGERYDRFLKICRKIPTRVIL